MGWQAVKLGRYVLHEPIAAGGMATVHLARLLGPHGFARTVAIKRMHPHLSADPELVRMFRDEATLAGRIRHPNVVVPIDVVAEGAELYLVMDYVEGEALSQLLSVAPRPIPLEVIAAIVLGVAYGLESAHRALGEHGQPLGIVHRDVSPQNILVGSDGVARVLDFGIAKVTSRARATLGATPIGKLGYMAPERLTGRPVDHRADVWSLGVVLFELLSGERLFGADDLAIAIKEVLGAQLPPLTRCDLPTELRGIVEQALAVEPDARYSSAQGLARALEQCVRPASPTDVAEWLWAQAQERLEGRRRLVQSIERGLEAPSPDRLVSATAATERQGPPDPILRSQATYAFAHEAERRGRGALLHSFGIDPDPGAMELRLPLSQLRAFPAALAELEGEPDLGLRLGMDAPRGVYGLFEYVVRSAPTLTTACERLVRYQPLADPNIRFELEPSAEGGTLRHLVPDQPLALGRQANEFVLAVLVRIFREATGEPGLVRAVGLAHPAPADVTLHRYFFGCPLTFDQGENSVSFVPGALERPLEVPDTILARVLFEQAEHRLRALTDEPPSEA